MYYCVISEQWVDVCEGNGRRVRRFTPYQTPVLNAQVNGDQVVIQCADNWTFVYEIGGSLIRRIHGH